LDERRGEQKRIDEEYYEKESEKRASGKEWARGE